MTVDALPTFPSTDNDLPPEFIAKADALLAAIVQMVVQINAVAAGYQTALWVAATSYLIGEKVYSPVDFKTYRRRTNGVTATDPSADTTNWTLVEPGGWPNDIINAIDPTDISADTNDYAPTGLSTASVIQLGATGASRTLTGLTGGAAGRPIFLQAQSGSQDILLADQNTGSAAANRFKQVLANALVSSIADDGDESYMNPGSMYLALYDETLQRWFLHGADEAPGHEVDTAWVVRQVTGQHIGKPVPSSRMYWHPGVAQAWLSALVTGAVPAISESHNISSITDTATGRLTVTINQDFTAATWNCVCSCERPVTSLLEGADRKVTLEFGSQAVGSCILECFDSAPTTMIIKDPTTWHMMANGNFY